MDRADLLAPKLPQIKTSQEIFWVSTYHPDLACLEDLIFKHWHHLAGKNFVTKVFWRVPVKLQAALVRSDLAAEHPARLTVPRETYTKACNHRLCKTCAWINPNPSVTSYTTKLSYRIRPSGSTCSTSNIVYAITFNCGQIYIGETSQPLNRRMNGHRSAIMTRDLRQPVTAHFCEHGHLLEDIAVSVLQVTNSDSQRFTAEKRWISQLVCDHPHGLNLEHVLAKERHLVPPVAPSASSRRSSAPTS